MDEGVDAHGAGVSDGDVVGFEDAVFHGVCLKGAACVEGGVVSDRDEGFLGDAAAVVEDSDLRNLGEDRS
jgi:hypothetical protein